jgi:hypothetical protein
VAWTDSRKRRQPVLLYFIETAARIKKNSEVYLNTTKILEQNFPFFATFKLCMFTLTVIGIH